MQNLPLVFNITLALIFAFIGGMAARKIGLPAIVGYLLGGILIGPFTPGFVGDVHTIHQFAELGVIFLMFGTGLHFSFQDLWKVRDIAVPGALLQTLLSTLVAFGVCQYWGWAPIAGLVFGLSISVASTVVLLRGLMDRNLLSTPHGQSAVGWLVMEDIISVLIIVLIPALAPQNGAFEWQSLAFTLLKAAAFGLIMFFGGSRFIPWLLNQIAHTRSRELFILAILAITLGVSLLAAELFGVSLALGAFVAGAIISQSHLSHQVSAEIFSFQEAFSILFFVSVGMLVNPVFVWENIDKVLILTLLVVVGKFLITLGLSVLSSRPARTFLVIAVGLSQIGEFSFIIGQTGVTYNLLSADQYSLILAGSLFSISVNPLMYQLLPKFEAFFKKIPPLWKRMDTHKEFPLINDSDQKDHVVIVGYGRVGKSLVDILETLEIPILVIDSDPELYEELTERRIKTLYGDAANSEVIKSANIGQARALVITVKDDMAAATIVLAGKNINPEIPIIARVESKEGVEHLNKLGARFVIEPELQGGLEIINHTLLQLGFPLRQVHDYTETIRRDQYNLEINSDEEHRSLYELLQAYKGIEIEWFSLDKDSPLVGQSLVEANIRSVTGASVVGILRDQHLIANPKSATVFQKGDRIGLIGEIAQIQAASTLIKLPSLEELENSPE